MWLRPHRWWHQHLFPCPSPSTPLNWITLYSKISCVSSLSPDDSERKNYCLQTRNMTDETEAAMAALSDATIKFIPSHNTRCLWATLPKLHIQSINQKKSIWIKMICLCGCLNCSKSTSAFSSSSSPQLLLPSCFFLWMETPWIGSSRGRSEKEGLGGASMMDVGLYVTWCLCSVSREAACLWVILSGEEEGLGWQSREEFFVFVSDFYLSPLVSIIQLMQETPDLLHLLLTSLSLTYTPSLDSVPSSWIVKCMDRPPRGQGVMGGGLTHRNYG